MIENPKEMFLDKYFGNYTLYGIENAMVKVSKALGARESKRDDSKRKKKCHYIYFEKWWFFIHRFKLLNSYEKKILGSAIDNEPKIEPHIKNVCKKAEQNEKY